MKTARELAMQSFTYLHRLRPNVPNVPAVPKKHYSSSTVGSNILAEYYDVREEFLMLTCILIYDLRHLGEF